MSVVSPMSWLLLTQGRSPWYLLDRELGRPQSCSGCLGEKINLAYARIQTPDGPALSLATILTMLSWLPFDHSVLLEFKYNRI
jgi:hypothetical protein